MRTPHIIACFLLLLLTTSCAGNRNQERMDLLQKQGNFREQSYTTPTFTLFGLFRPGKGDVLRVYVEGDGMAWQSRRRISADPTPRDDVALRLASADNSGQPVLYLARPCQYSANTDPLCRPRYWTSARLAPEVITALNAAVDRAKAQSTTSHVALVGFSGGGGAVALMAAERRDVSFLGTVAGTLDHKAWTEHHKVSPLHHSLNPIDKAGILAPLPQRHVSGGSDTVMPPEIAQSFCRTLGRPELCRTIPGLAHDGAWEQHWDYRYTD